MVIPQDLCTCCLLCLGVLSPRSFHGNSSSFSSQPKSRHLSQVSQAPGTPYPITGLASLWYSLPHELTVLFFSFTVYRSVSLHTHTHRHICSLHERRETEDLDRGQISTIFRSDLRSMETLGHEREGCHPRKSTLATV